ncbi:hypothetical protein P43SY_001162 [Pythium insidiosum]|uniref:K Homology domain-containing protein n=1 Tax=Pythium insidiosum TaxID=114742 RepID=A0AAD5LX45_PYTIN|nr:hypothetical protein P43SY_001162 [Pythium insidiosum]
MSMTMAKDAETAAPPPPAALPAASVAVSTSTDHATLRRSRLRDMRSVRSGGARSHAATATATRPTARQPRRHGAAEGDRPSWGRRARGARDGDQSGKEKAKTKTPLPSTASEMLTPLDASTTLFPDRVQPREEAPREEAVAPRGHPSDGARPDHDEEHKNEAPDSARRQQRVRCLNVKTTVLPDLLVPYLYGDRQNRIGNIMERTGSTIDYCPLSPDEQAQSPPNMTYTMSFLVSAESATQLDSACKMLRSLVERLQLHVQQKLAASGMRRRPEAARTPPHRDHAQDSSMGQQREMFCAPPVGMDMAPPQHQVAALAMNQ